jgi:hypothetical protein
MIQHAATPRPAATWTNYVHLPCPHCDYRGSHYSGARFFGSGVLATPPCPSCEAGRLQRVGSWDLRFQAWPWLTGEGER